MIICNENGMIDVSGSPDEILREFASVFVSLFYLVNEETGVSLDSCFEKVLDIMEFYNQKLYAVLSKEEKIFDPYAYDGSTSVEEERKSADAYNLDNFMQTYSEEMTAFAVSHTQDEFKDYFAKRSAEALGEYDTAHPDETWHKSMLNNPDYIKSISDTVSTPFYNDIALNKA